MSTRRTFLKLVAAAGTISLPNMALAAGKKVVIVGGGTGGATVAKYLRRADSSIEVTLIEKNASYLTCYMSNEVLGGDRDLESLRFNYNTLQSVYGVNVVEDEVIAIDPVTHTVTTKNGGSYNYDRCVVSPGIDFRYDTIEGYDANVAENIPHAWKAGEQTLTLRAQLESMSDGGTVVIAAPPNPYRCPPAPYERASLIAHYLKQHKPSSKVIILDSKTSFAKQDLFMQAWRDLYPNMIEWQSGEGVTSVDANNRTVITSSGNSYQSDVLNIIPAQKAGAIAFAADLTDDSGWCPVDVQTFESTRHQDIHVIGDACTASPLPKSGFAANSEAKACATAIAALLNGQAITSPSFSNGCYSIVGTDYAISIVAIYRLAEDGKSIIKVPGSGGTSSIDATAEQRKLDVQYAYGWYNNLTLDVFK
ncbi:NAD(P)/FAD-dependent oxidoreductase [Candidatus Marithrix sp. Canyon 246]|uniref:NAD(P)/FAD-dependent oxidoreductase n=1 Tax=Candidatus Marithrix sp. Canyon 246 TaxID=1827136 RepID=UPI000849FF89|nr:NAD(P)/FAD-dependent oxidoreductase [Candidatus Marithrix sp. Canyon 246]